MSDIVFPPKHTCLFDRDIIEFPAVVDGKTITCRITLEDMNREYSVGTTPKTFDQHFEMLRPEIEKRAREQILAKGPESQ